MSLYVVINRKLINITAISMFNLQAWKTTLRITICYAQAYPELYLFQVDLYQDIYLPNKIFYVTKDASNKSAYMSYNCKALI